jgi:flagellar protein FlbD
VLQLTRLSGPVFALNPDLIERAESTPDTVVTLVNGSKYVIRESLDELIELVRQYRVGLIVAAGEVAAHPVTGPSPTSDTAYARSRARREPAGEGTVVALRPGED